MSRTRLGRFTDARSRVPIMRLPTGTNVLILAVAFRPAPWYVVKLEVDGSSGPPHPCKSLVQAKRVARTLLDGRVPREAKPEGGLDG